MTRDELLEAVDACYEAVVRKLPKQDRPPGQGLIHPAGLIDRDRKRMPDGH